MYPPRRKKTDFEQVSTKDWTTGTISEIEYKENHERIWKGEKKTGPAVRLKFTLDGYKFPHSSGWLTFSYGEKTGLYSRYISALVEGAEPDMKFDLDELKDMPIKIMWKQNGEYQNVELIRPLEEKIVPSAEPPEEAPPEVEDIQF